MSKDDILVYRDILLKPRLDIIARILPNFSTCTHLHTHVHTYIHRYIHMYTLTYTGTYTRTQTHKHIPYI